MTRSILLRAFFASLAAFLVLTGCGNPASPTGNDGNDDTYLSALSVSAGGSALPLSFYRTTLNYRVNVQNSVTDVEVTAQARDGNATVVVSGESGLAEGSNTVTVVVTAEDGTTQRTYTIVVYRAPSGASTDASLSALEVNSSAVSGFASDTLEYDIDDVPSTTATVTVTATATETNAAVDVSGHTSLAVGGNTITITVTAPDGVTTREYTVDVIRHGVTITSPAAGATVDTETFTIGGSYYGSSAPTMSLTFGCLTNVTVTVYAPSDGVGAWTTDISSTQIDDNPSDYTRGGKSLYAEASWDASDIAGCFGAIDYQYTGADVAYSISGTITTSETIPEGYHLFVYIFEAGAADDAYPVAITSATVTATTFDDGYDYTLSGVPAGTYELYALVAESFDAEEVPYYADGGNVTIGSSDLTGQNLVLEEY